MARSFAAVIRRQLPAYSPIRPRAFVDAVTELAPGEARATERLRALLGARFAADPVVLTGSGTQALQLALALASSSDPHPGRSVALPAYGCYDLVSAAAGARATVVFYDVDPVTLTPEPESVRGVLGRGVGVFVGANLFGFPVDWDWLKTECRAAGALLVEDAAQALGSAWDGRDAGTHGDVVVLSFGRGKGWTGGGGGALLVREGALRSRSLPNLSEPPSGTGVKALAVSVVQWAVGRPSLYWLPELAPGVRLGETVYRPPVAPTRISAASAALVLRHDEPSRQAVEDRRSWARRIQTLLPELGVAGCRPLDGGCCGYLRYPVTATDSGRAAALEARGRSLGIVRGYPVALPDLSHAAALRSDAVTDAPGARALAQRLVTLPTHPLLRPRDLDAIRRLLVAS